MCGMFSSEKVNLLKQKLLVMQKDVSVSSSDTYYLGNWEIFPNEFPEHKQSHPEQQEQEG